MRKTNCKTMVWILLPVLMFAFVGSAFADEVAVEATMTEQEQICFDAINQMRAKVGLPPFTFCPELSEECRQWSAKLRASAKLYHGSSFENCARGNESGAATYRQWYNSSGHRALFYNRGTEAGIGSDGTYWTFRVRNCEKGKIEADDEEIVAEEKKAVKTTYSVARRPLRVLFR